MSLSTELPKEEEENGDGTANDGYNIKSTEEGGRARRKCAWFLISYALDQLQLKSFCLSPKGQCCIIF